MKALVCESCGANAFLEKDGFRICRYCETKYVISREDFTFATNAAPFNSQKPLSNGTTIALNDDIQMLLAKCRNEPFNAKRYANRILDIDPSNAEALKILRRR